MARTLTFTLGGTDYAASPTKIDRRKLYGWTQTLALDDAGEECALASMDGSGTFIIPAGGTGLGVLDPDGAWVDRDELKAVTLDGADAPLLASSYDSPVPLATPATCDDLLDCNITSVYQLDDGQALAAALGEGIYSFEYVYRAGYTGNLAFVLAAGGEAFMLVGYRNHFDYLGLDQADNIDDSETDLDESESDDIDFSMF